MSKSTGIGRGGQRTNSWRPRKALCETTYTGYSYGSDPMEDLLNEKWL